VLPASDDGRESSDYPQDVIRRTATAVVVLAFMAVPLVASAGQGEVVLGKKNLTGRYGIGWGTVRPVVIYNGGVPSGKAWNLRWRNWGSASSIAHGLTWLYRPSGGYYGKPGAIEFRAYRIGHCVAGGKRAYTRLAARVALRPGGALGRWFAWGGWRTICRFG
jgi:hypothetical protein